MMKYQYGSSLLHWKRACLLLSKYQGALLSGGSKGEPCFLGFFSESLRHYEKEDMINIQRDGKSFGGCADLLCNLR